jgi:hypothetical protein
MPLTAERLKDILDNQNSFFELFLVKSLERILNELDPLALDEILDAMIPETVNSQLVMFGRKIGDYMGFDRATIKAKFKKPDGSALTDADVDDIFEAAGIITGTSAPSPMGGPASSPQRGPAEAEADKKEAKAKEAAGKPSAAPKPAAHPNEEKKTKDEAKK